VAIAALGGCYFALHPGLTAPVGHGHGTVGFDLGIGVGGEYASSAVRVGGGANIGPRIADDNGYEPVGVEGHAVIPLAGDPIGNQHRLLLATHASFGFAFGTTKTGPGMQPTAPDGWVGEGFVGIGLGATTTQPDNADHRDDIVAGHIALGVSAQRFWPDGGDPFWFLGLALDLSYSWQNGGEWAH
jgi:hypothetical protein